MIPNEPTPDKETPESPDVPNSDNQAPEEPIDANDTPVQITADTGTNDAQQGPETTEIEKVDLVETTKPKVKGQLSLVKAIDKILGEVTEDQITGLIKLYKIITKKISVDHSELLDRLVESETLGRCTEFLEQVEHPKLQIQSCIVLCNLAAGTSADTDAVVEAGAVEPLITCLGSSDLELATEALWALGNIAGDGPKHSGHLIDKGIVVPLIALAERQSEAEHFKITAFTISMLCRGPNGTGYFRHSVPRRLNPCLPVLIRLVREWFENLDMLEDTLWGLYYLTASGMGELLNQVVNSGIVPRLVETLAHREHSVITPCISLLGSVISSDNHHYTDVVLNAGLLPFLEPLIREPTHEKDITWMLSNIGAGNEAQRSALLQSGMIPLVIRVLQSERVSARKEAAYTISILLEGGPVDHVRFLFNNGVIPPLVLLLDSRKSEIVRVVLNGLISGLQHLQSTEEQEPFIRMIQESGGFAKLTRLQSHSDDDVSEQTGLLLDILLSNDEDNLDLFDDDFAD